MKYYLQWTIGPIWKYKTSAPNGKFCSRKRLQNAWNIIIIILQGRLKWNSWIGIYILNTYITTYIYNINIYNIILGRHLPVTLCCVYVYKSKDPKREKKKAVVFCKLSFRWPDDHRTLERKKPLIKKKKMTTRESQRK